MKLTNIAYKIFAISVVALVVAPLTSSFGFYDSLNDEIYATSVSTSDTAVAAADDTTSDSDSSTSATITADDTENFNYNFNSIAEKEIYDYDVSFTFDGTTYTGLYKNNFKGEDVDNVNTKLDDLGTIENPYVILELAPDETLTEMRAYVGQSSVFGMTQEEYDAIKLTDDEEQACKDKAREYLFYQLTAKYNNGVGLTYASLYTSNIVAIKGNNQYWNPDPLEVMQVLGKVPGFEDFVVNYNNQNGVALYNEIMEDIEEIIDENYATYGITSFTEEYQNRLTSALEDKKEKAVSERIRDEANSAGFGYAYKFKIKYQLDNGNFSTYTDNTTKTSNLGSSTKTQAFAGEYQIDISTYSDNSRFVSTNEFIKGCINLAFDKETYIDANGNEQIAANSMSPYIDDYIFCGWYYYEGNDTSNAAKKVTSDTNLKELGITDLYTYWSARYYESNETQLITTGNDSDVLVNYGKDSYTIHLPSTIASRQTAENPYNNPKNQLSFAVITSYKGISQWYKGGEESKNDLLEISGWDMTFKTADITTGADLLKIAPMLMGDTDYYVATYNTIVSVDPDTGETVVNYYPYNVQFITITPDELNKLVYYDYATNNWSADEYHSETECTYLNKFLNDIDLIYITNGNTPIFQASKYKANRYQLPTLYTKNAGGTYTYKLTLSGDKYSGPKKDANLNTYINDVEWQAAYKIYTRALDDTQGRRVSMVMDRTTYSATANIDGHRNVLNLDKIFMFYFEASDPTLIYNMYVVDSEEWQPYNLQKVKGVVRNESDRDDGLKTYFTGSLYDQTAWNLQMFFPYEVLYEYGYTTYSHEDVAKDDLKLGTQFPWGNSITEFYSWFESFGLSTNLQPTTVVNYYARTFIGGTNIGQGFAVKNVSEEYSVTNDSNSNNTTLMFDYFTGPEGVRPSAVVNNYLSTENAIEFMVQMVRSNKTTANDREITIVNSVSPDVKYKTTLGTTFKVPRVLADISIPESWVEYNFYTSNDGYYVAEYYWTPTFQNIDNINATANIAFKYYTSTTTDENLKWIKLDVESNGTKFKSNFYSNIYLYETFNTVNNDDGSVSAGTKVDFATTGISHSIAAKNNRVPYLFLAEYQPTINGSLKKGQYVIVVQCYQSQSAYNSGADPVASKVTMHNVVLEKAKFLFNLD